MEPTGVFCHHYSQQTESRPINLPIFTAYHQFVWATKLKMPSFRLKNKTKNYTYLSSIFNPNICSKIKSTFTANLKVRPWYLTGSFPLNVFRGLYISHFIRPSLAYISQVASFTPEKNSGKSNHTASIELPHFPFQRFFRSVEPPSTTSEISNPLNFLLLPSNSPKLHW